MLGEGGRHLHRHGTVHGGGQAPPDHRRDLRERRRRPRKGYAPLRTGTQTYRADMLVYFSSTKKFS